VIDGHELANAAREKIRTGVEDILDVIVHVDPDPDKSLMQ
jgi:divalent metal cation (Fe/Co/Zn/Cd) transporter